MKDLIDGVVRAIGSKHKRVGLGHLCCVNRFPTCDLDDVELRNPVHAYAPVRGEEN